MSFLKKLFGSSERNTTGFGLTDKGMVRENNEDYLQLPRTENFLLLPMEWGGIRLVRWPAKWPQTRL